MLEPDLRGTGRTSMLIQNAPYGSVFITQSFNMARYCAQIAGDRLGRGDIRFIDVYNATRNNGGFFRGRREVSIVFDHDVLLSERDQEIFNYLKAVRAIV